MKNVKLSLLVGWASLVLSGGVVCLGGEPGAFHLFRGIVKGLDRGCVRVRSKREERCFQLGSVIPSRRLKVGDRVTIRYVLEATELKFEKGNPTFGPSREEAQENEEGVPGVIDDRAFYESRRDAPRETLEQKFEQVLHEKS